MSWGQNLIVFKVSISHDVSKQEGIEKSYTQSQAKSYQTHSRSSPNISHSITQHKITPTMSSQYAGRLPQWIENNDTYVKDVFPTLPAPWHMVDQRKAVTDKTTLVREFDLPCRILLSLPCEPCTDSPIPFLVTCLDPRCVPEDFFGPNLAGGVFRNAGGRATDDAIRSITLLRGLADLRTVVVVHHTGGSFSLPFPSLSITSFPFLFPIS